MRNIIGITGFANSGKDTVADFIILRNKSFKKISFADPLKDIAIKYFGLSKEDVFTTEGKNKYNDFWDMTNREILQKLGTDAMRKGFHQNVWVMLAEQNLLKNINQNFIFADIRFNNEAELVKKYNGIIIKVNRNKHITESQHESEKPIDSSFIDFELDNTSTFERLYYNILMNFNEKVKEIKL